MHTSAHTWGIAWFGHSLWELVPFLHHVGPRDWTQIVELGGKHICLSRCLCNPTPPHVCIYMCTHVCHVTRLMSAVSLNQFASYFFFFKKGRVSCWTGAQDSSHAVWLVSPLGASPRARMIAVLFVWVLGFHTRFPIFVCWGLCWRSHLSASPPQTFWP